MKRKNRVVVEFTSAKPITQKQARIRVEQILELGLSTASTRPRWWRFKAVKITTKEFERVLRALRRTENAKHRPLH